MKKPTGGNCTNGNVRLISSSGRSEGRVEVCYNKQWGTVCSSGWSSDSTDVACSELGYTGNSHQRSYSYFSYTSKPIWFRNVNCNGSELSLFDCSKTISSLGCFHSLDVRIRCYCKYFILINSKIYIINFTFQTLASDDSQCTNGAVRLWSAYDSTPANEGVIQICRLGRWYAMCDIYSSYSTCYIGRIVCKSLGYPGAIS